MLSMLSLDRGSVDLWYMYINVHGFVLYIYIYSHPSLSLFVCIYTYIYIYILYKLIMMTLHFL